MRAVLAVVGLLVLVIGLGYCARGGGDAQALRAAEARAAKAEAHAVAAETAAKASEEKLYECQVELDWRKAK